MGRTKVQNIRSPGSLQGLRDRQNAVKEAISLLRKNVDEEEIVRKVWARLLCNKEKAEDIVDTAKNYLEVNGTDESVEEEVREED